METTLTVGMIVWPLLALLGFAAIVGIFLFVLSIIAKGFEH